MRLPWGDQALQWRYIINLLVVKVNPTVTPLRETLRWRLRAIPKSIIILIKSKGVKNKMMKILCASSHPKHFISINVSPKKTKSMKK